jgi:SagB-type dehydrogenase family enzyme
MNQTQTLYDTANGSTVSTRFRLRAGAQVVRSDRRTSVQREGLLPLHIDGATATEDAVLSQLQGAFSTLEQLTASAGGGGEVVVLAQRYALLDMLRRLGLLEVSVYVGSKPAAVLEFLHCPSERGALPSNDVEMRLSRLVTLRPHGASFVLEVAGGAAKLRLFDARALAAIASLEVAQSEQADEVSVELRNALVALLAEAGALEDTTTASAAQTWNAYDLAFHFHSRRGDPDSSYGACFPLRASMSPPPAVKPAATLDAIALPVPDLAALQLTDRPFSAVLEARRSTRVHGCQPLSLSDLGAFLFRTARVRDMRMVSGMEISDRPYPSGGACHELELYLVPANCEGVAAGLYRYDPLAHALCPVVAGLTETVQRLVDNAKIACQMQAPPQLVIVIAARFGRVQWKYAGMPYALILKHVGVLTQTMYLVAEAMGLAACAVGGGSAPHFAEASRLDPLEEGSVGEFVLGTMPA